MKNFIYLLVFISLFSCHNKKEKPSPPELSIQEYKSIMKDLILAQKIREIMVKKDSLLDPVALVYKSHNIDSLKLKKATDYYSSDPQNFVKIYQSIKDELKQKLDSLEKNSSIGEAKKIKTDSIKVKEARLEKVFQHKRKTKSQK